ncbi:hypothetical protein CB1_000144018 [Camelus ferus]|nr:hypothetical protein CB1_000144018 [Camelus ferus]
MASARPAQEEPSTTPPGKVVTVSSRSPRCPRNQAALRHGKTFSSSSTPCSSGLRNPPRHLLVAGPSSTGGSDADGGLFAVPTTLPPNSRHGKLFSPSKETELTFRQHLNSISMQSDFFLPKPRKLRNRHLRKPLVVQRTLLPRPSENQSHNVCSFSILSNSSVTGRGSFRPIQSSLTKAALSRPIVPKVLPPQAPGHLANEVTAAVSGQDSTSTHRNGEPIPDVGGTGDPFISIPSRQEPVADSFQSSPVLSLSELSRAPLHNGSSSTRLSPPNVSALLDISLPGPPEDVLSQGEPATQISDSIIEIAISSGQYTSFISPEKSRKMLPTPVGTNSGTSLLGPSLLDGNSRDSFVSRSLADVAEVVDSQLVCMMNENSIDYISRFNDLAQELSITEPGRREVLFDGGGGGPPLAVEWQPSGPILALSTGLSRSARGGGKGSGIFDESKPVQTRQRLNPPGGKASDIFGSPVTATSPLAHPNKPKDHVLLCEGEDPVPDLKAADGNKQGGGYCEVSYLEKSGEMGSVMSAAASASPRQEPGERGGPREADGAQGPAPTVDSHEPRLGPRPRSHNKVLNPPGGKSSISFY